MGDPALGRDGAGVEEEVAGTGSASSFEGGEEAGVLASHEAQRLSTMRILILWHSLTHHGLVIMSLCLKIFFSGTVRDH